MNQRYKFVKMHPFLSEHFPHKFVKHFIQHWYVYNCFIYFNKVLKKTKSITLMNIKRKILQLKKFAYFIQFSFVLSQSSWFNEKSDKNHLTNIHNFCSYIPHGMPEISFYSLEQLKIIE